MDVGSYSINVVLWELREEISELRERNLALQKRIARVSELPAYWRGRDNCDCYEAAIELESALADATG
jgi:hypothetical protein